MLGTSRARAAALAAVVVGGTIVAACQSTPTPSELQDPRAILAAVVTTTGAAKTVRVDATADGSVALDLLGIGTASTVELNGTTASADLDLARGNARTTFSAPGLLGLTGELIALDGTSYFKSTLTGTLYQVQPIGAAGPIPSGEASDTILKGLTDVLANPTLRPIKKDDEPCGSATCYRVDITLTPADLAALGAGDLRTPAGLPVPIQLPDLTAATVDLRVLVAKDSTHLASLRAAVDLGAAGSPVLELTFSKWDEAVSISAPPADQLAPSD